MSNTPFSTQRNALSIEIFVGAEDAFDVTSTLVCGEREAVLIDAQFTRGDALKLADRIRATGKQLTTVYVTHAHPDHYWGFTTLAEQFPEARLVTAPQVIPVIEETLAAKLAQWKPLYRDELPDAPIKPAALLGDVIHLEGNALRILNLGQGDVRSSTAVWIPSLSTLVAGDLAYNGTHVWLAETNRERRMQWIANLDGLASMNPRIVAGHKVPNADDEGIRVLLTETRDYIAAFDTALDYCSSAEDLIETMTASYPGRALPMILQIAAGAVFAGREAVGEQRRAA